MIYTVIKKTSLHSSGQYKGLIVEVNEMIAAGWEPLGGICIKPGEEGEYTEYLQAMIDRNQSQTG